MYLILKTFWKKPILKINLYRLSFQTENETIETLLGYLQVTKSQISFEAYAIYKKYRILKGPMVFSEVKSNIGFAYDKESGNFTAPVSGNYSFRLVKEGYDGRDGRRINASISIMNNGTPQTFVRGLPTDMFSDMYTQSRYSYELYNFDKTWYLNLTKADVINLNSRWDLKIGDHYKLERITWSGFLVEAFQD